MNVTNIKLRGSLSALDQAAKKRLMQMESLLKANKYGQLNTDKFDEFVLQMDKLVHEVEELRVEFNALVPKTEPAKTDTVGLDANTFRPTYEVAG